MKNSLKNGSGFTIGSCRYIMKDASDEGFYAQVVELKLIKIKAKPKKEIIEAVEEDVHIRKDTKE